MRKYIKRLLNMGAALVVSLLPVMVTPSAHAVSSQGPTELASVATDGGLPNGTSGYPTVSQDGRYVYFQSYASNLVPNDTNNSFDIFVRDRVSGTTKRIDLTSSGAELNKGVFSSQWGISDDGRYLVFASGSNNLNPNLNSSCVFLRDLQTGVTTTVYGCYPLGFAAGSPSISGNGEKIVFGGTDTNNVNHLYLYDRITDSMQNLNIGSGGSAPNASLLNASLNYDGSVVVFDTLASNLVDNDTNDRNDVFAWNENTNTTMLVSVSNTGALGDADSYSGGVSGDGKKVVIASTSTNLADSVTPYNVVQNYIRDLNTNTTTLLNANSSGQHGNGQAGWTRISEDGNFVAFESLSSNLVTGSAVNENADYVKDLQSGGITLVSVDNNGNEYTGTGNSGKPIGISSTGRYVVFQIPTDGTQGYAVYWHDRLSPIPTPPTGLNASTPTQRPVLSWNAVPGVTTYNIYRDSISVGSSTSTSYTDSSAPEGTHSYYVTAVNGGGESSASNTVSVIVDRTKPTVTVTPASGSVLQGTTTFTITISDNNALSVSKNKSIWVYLYDTAGAQKHSGAKVDLSNGTGTFTVTTALLDNGNANLDVGIVYDAAGNASGTTDNYFRSYTINN